MALAVELVVEAVLEGLVVRMIDDGLAVRIEQGLGVVLATHEVDAEVREVDAAAAGRALVDGGDKRLGVLGQELVKQQVASLVDREVLLRSEEAVEGLERELQRLVLFARLVQHDGVRRPHEHVGALLLDGHAHHAHAHGGVGRATREVEEVVVGELVARIHVLERGPEGLHDEVGEIAIDVFLDLIDQREEELHAARLRHLGKDAAQHGRASFLGHQREEAADPVPAVAIELLEQPLALLFVEQRLLEVALELRNELQPVAGLLRILEDHRDDVLAEAAVLLLGEQHADLLEHRLEAVRRIGRLVALHEHLDPVTAERECEATVLHLERRALQHGHQLLVFLVDAREVETAQQRTRALLIALDE